MAEDELQVAERKGAGVVKGDADAAQLPLEGQRH